ncbi:HNH endonuclease, partial [bacterium]|nr:HNH endonuclease [bacterium]
MSKCVYCLREQDEPFRDEHVIPRSLGKFHLEGREVILNNKVCDACNHELGKCDGELAYGGYEAFMRRKIGV